MSKKIQQGKALRGRIGPRHFLASVVPWSSLKKNSNIIIILPVVDVKTFFGVNLYFLKIKKFNKVCSYDSTCTKMLKLIYFQLNYFQTLFIGSKMVYCCCFITSINVLWTRLRRVIYTSGQPRQSWTFCKTNLVLKNTNWVKVQFSDLVQLCLEKLNLLVLKNRHLEL